jgi:hypothetical protein
MQTNTSQNSLQNRAAGTPGTGAAQAHDGSAASGPTKPQARPSKQWYDRVQYYLEHDPACRRLPSKSDQPITSRFGEVLFYSKEVVEIVETLYQEGKKPRKNEVLKLGMQLKRRLPVIQVPMQAPSTSATPSPTQPVKASPTRAEPDPTKTSPGVSEDAPPPAAPVVGVRTSRALSNKKAESITNDGPPGHDGERAESAPTSQLPTVSEAVVVTEDSADYWVSQINEHLTEGVESLVKAGHDLEAAKSKLPHGEFQSMFAPGRLRISQRTAELFMQVARHPALSKPKNYSLLPPTLNALTTLSRLPEAKLQMAIDEHKIAPHMTISEARALVVELDDKAQQQPEPESEAQLCARRLKIVGRFIEEAKGWPDEHRNRFIQELRALLKSMEPSPPADQRDLGTNA